MRRGRGMCPCGVGRTWLRLSVSIGQATTQWWLGLKTLLFQICITETRPDSKAPRNAKPWWFPASFLAYCPHCWAFTTRNTNKSNRGKIHLWIKAALRRKIGSNLHSKSSSSRTKDLEGMETSSEWSTWSSAKSSSDCRENDCNPKTQSEASTCKGRGHQILCKSHRTR